MAPDAEIEVRIVDAFEIVLVEKRARTPREQSTHIVELTLPDREVRVNGVVFDSAGEPAKGAVVLLQAPRRSRSVRTDQAGRFQFEGLHAVGQQLGFLVQHADHADVLRAPAPLQDDLDLRFDLQRGFSIEVMVVDPLGRPVDAGVTVRGLAQSAPTTRIAPGIRRAQRIPAGVQEFVALIGTREFPVRHDPVAGNLRIEVPPAGEVDAEVDVARAGEHRYLTITLLQDDVAVAHLHARRAGTVYRATTRAALAGRYTAVLKSGDTELSRSQIEVVAGQRTTIR